MKGAFNAIRSQGQAAMEGVLQRRNPAAYAAYQVAGKAARYVSARIRANRVRAQARSARYRRPDRRFVPGARNYKWHTTGKYVGPFKKVTKRGARTAFDAYNKVGVVHTSETIGSVTDQDCCYIMNEVINSRDLIYYIVCAMIRKLIEKAGFRVEGIDSCPFDKDAGDSNEVNYHVQLVTHNYQTGAATVRDYKVLAGNTFGVICDDFRNSFEQYCSGHGELALENMDEPYKFVLWQGPDDGTGANIRSVMIMNETFIDLFGTAEMKVQNRTKATGGSEDAENVNNNPLQGWSYLFNGVPKAKANGREAAVSQPATLVFERMQYPNGVTSFGIGVGTSPDFKEPPFPKMFWNCVKASKIRLEPGNIKSFTAAKRRSGNVLKILKTIRLQLNIPGTYSTYSVHPVQMIALEDVINANAAETISVQFEVERKLGVKCWTKQKKYFRTDYEVRV